MYDELGDDADGVAEEAGEISSEVGGGGASGVVDVDGAGEGLDLCWRARDDWR